MTATAAQRPLALSAAADGVQAFALRLPADATEAPQAQRERLRSATQQAMCRTLSTALACDVQQLQVRATPGQAPQLWRSGQRLPAIHLSTAYAGRLAVWAWSARGAVGIDVEPVPSISAAEAAHWQATAALYLTPQALAALPPLRHADGAPAFAMHWALLEAQLKCAGMALAEAHLRPPPWNAGMQTATLHLPAGWGALAAAVAWR